MRPIRPAGNGPDVGKSRRWIRFVIDPNDSDEEAYLKLKAIHDEYGPKAGTNPPDEAAPHRPESGNQPSPSH